MFETDQSWDGGGWNSGYMRQEYWYDFFPFSLITAPIRSVATQLGSWASAGLKALLSLLGMAETDSRSASNWGSFEDRMPPASMRNNATKGWWCAQQRLMAALADVLRTAPMLPEFLLIIDDDTFVNVRALRRYVHTKSPDRMIYAGDKHAGFPFLFGGGGHLLSRALMVPAQGADPRVLEARRGRVVRVAQRLDSPRVPALPRPASAAQHHRRLPTLPTGLWNEHQARQARGVKPPQTATSFASKV